MDAVSSFEGMAGKGVSLVNFFAPFANCGGSKCSYYKFPGERDGRHPRARLDPGLQLELAVDPLQPQRARLPARRRDRRHLRLLHPRIRRRRPRLGPPLLPPLQLGDERQLVPLVGGRQRQPDAASTSPPGATCTTSSPRSAPTTSPGSGAPTSIPATSCRAASPPSTPATTTSTGPASTATTGARARAAGPASRTSTSSTYHEITDTIAPGKPLMIGEIGSTENGGSKAELDQRSAGGNPDRLPATSAAMLWFDTFDDGMDWPIETSSSATSAFAAGSRDPGLPEQLLRRPARRRDRTARLSRLDVCPRLTSPEQEERAACDFGLQQRSPASFSWPVRSACWALRWRRGDRPRNQARASTAPRSTSRECWSSATMPAPERHASLARHHRKRPGRDRRWPRRSQRAEPLRRALAARRSGRREPDRERDRGHGRRAASTDNAPPKTTGSSPSSPATPGAPIGCPPPPHPAKAPRQRSTGAPRSAAS